MRIGIHYDPPSPTSFTMDLYRGCRSGPILFSLRSGEKLFEVDPVSVEDYLPHLWDMIEIGAVQPRRGGCLTAEDLGSYSDPTSQRALCYLFDYLEDLQRHGVSAALDNSLEYLWKYCKSRPRDHHPRRDLDEITAVFSRLGNIFSDFGCHPHMFTTMSTFFTRHCTEIMQRGRRTWVDYLSALEQNTDDDRDLIPALNRIAQQKVHAEEIRDSAYGGTIGGHTLRPDTVDLLESLIEQKHDQDVVRHLDNSRRFSPGYRRPGSHHGRGRYHGDSMRRGINYHPRDLQKIAARDPEAILVDERLRRRPHQRLLYIEDDYSDSGYNSEIGFEHGRTRLPHQMRRARHDHMIEDVGRRRRSISLDNFQDISMDGRWREQADRRFGGGRTEMAMRV